MRVDPHWKRNLVVSVLCGAVGFLGARAIGVDNIMWWIRKDRLGGLRHQLFGCNGGFVVRYMGVDDREHRGLLCDECGEIIDKDRPARKHPMSASLSPADAGVALYRMTRAKSGPTIANDPDRISALMRDEGFSDAQSRGLMALNSRELMGLAYYAVPGSEREALAISAGRA